MRFEANRFAKNLGVTLLQKRFHLLSFDDLVMEPKKTLKALSVFLEVEYADIEDLVSIVHKPDSLGRYKEKDISIFSKTEIQEVEDFGFQVSMKK